MFRNSVVSAADGAKLSDTITINDQSSRVLPVPSSVNHAIRPVFYLVSNQCACVPFRATTGASGGLLRNIADSTICIPSEETPRIQECHILTGHIICEIVEQLMCGDAF